MTQGSIKFRMFGQVNQSADRKLGILAGTAELNIAKGIKELSANEKRALQTNIQRWLDGHNGPTSRFHHFEGDSIAPMGFVFKAFDHRFYGYRVNPLPKTSGHVQLVVLCSHAIKPGYNTDPEQKKFIKEMAQSPHSASAVRKIFDDTTKDEKKDKPRWTN